MKMGDELEGFLNRVFVFGRRAWRRFRNGWNGSFRLGATVGVLFVLAVQSCSATWKENRQFYEEDLRDYEAMLANPERLQREFEHYRNELGRNPVFADYSVDRETFVRNRRPSFRTPGWQLVIAVLLGGILLVRSLYHPDERAREALWDAGRDLLLGRDDHWWVERGVMNPRTGRFVRYPVEIDPDSGKLRYEGRIVKRRKRPKD